MDDTARHLDIRRRRQRALHFLEDREQFPRRQNVRVEVNLQRTDTRRHLDDTFESPRFERRHHRMGAETQREVEDDGAIFDKNIVVTRTPVGNFRLEVANPAKNRVFPLRLPGKRRCGPHKRLHPCFLHTPKLARLRFGDPVETHFVTRLQLAELPEFRFGKRRRTDEAAEARPVGAENDRHVAREIDRTDGIGIVMNIGGMKTRLATILARPLGLRPDQAHARARRIVVNLVRSVEQRLDILVEKEIRRTMWPVKRGDLPFACQRHTGRMGELHRHSRRDGAFLCNAQHIARLQGACAMPAEAAEGERGSRAKIARCVESVSNGKIGALPGALDLAKRERLSALHLECLPEGNGVIVKPCFHLRAGKRHRRLATEAERGPFKRHFEGGSVLRIPHQPVRKPMRQGIHRP